MDYKVGLLPAPRRHPFALVLTQRGAVARRLCATLRADRRSQRGLREAHAAQPINRMGQGVVHVDWKRVDESVFDIG